MRRLNPVIFSILVLAILAPFNFALPQNESGANETILNLMEEIFSQIPPDLAEIDPDLKRIAVYRVDTDEASIPPPLREHFESKLVEVFRAIGQPAMVSLPELNTLKISSTDSSFSILNSLPSPDELWRVGRRLRVDAFLEGNLTYVRKKALFLDLRLNRTGTNEVLWAKSYAAYEKSFKPVAANPLMKSVNAGLEVFQVDVGSAADSLLHPDFKNRLIQYSVYFGLYQFMTSNSRLRYEFRAGLSFLSEGVNFANTSFTGNSFYSLEAGANALRNPVSYNFRALLYSTLLQSKKNRSGDWLSVYLALTRYFAVKMPDLTGIGVGFRSDLSSRFSVSAGFSMILGSEFDSEPIASTGERIRLKVDGLHYEVLMLQFSF